MRRNNYFLQKNSVLNMEGMREIITIRQLNHSNNYCRKDLPKNTKINGQKLNKWGNQADTTVIKWSKLTVSVRRHWYRVPCITQWEGHIASVAFFPKSCYFSLVLRKHQTNQNWWIFYQILALVLFKSVKVIHGRWGRTEDPLQTGGY